MKKILLLSLSLLTSMSLFASTPFETKLAELGISKDNCTNWSSQSTITMAEPTCAYANISGITALPDTTSGDLNAYIDFYDNAGNYFQKKIILGLQGNEELPKESLSIDLCEDNWVGDETTGVTFGDWVELDAFHLKAFYEDGLRGTAEVAYQLYAQITQRSLCYPKAFPVMLYVNGDFYGIMAWQIKKSRSNMGLDKKTSSHVWLDGTLNDNQLFQGSINWTKFEVRNPKDLYNMDGSDYDGDNPQEIIDATSSAYTGKSKMVRCAEAKQHIVDLSNYYSELKALADGGATTEEMKAAIETRFDVTELINYRIFSLITNNYDGFSKNWQWFTYNGSQWTVAPYGCELTFGYNDDTDEGYSIWEASRGSKKYDYKMENTQTDGPMYWIWNYYQDQLKSRYAELRKSGVITTSNIVALANAWQQRIGDANYSAEWERWPQSPLQLGNAETNSRWQEWVSNRISLEDSFLGYTDEALSGVNGEANEITGIYSIGGIRLSRQAKGLRIIRYANGEVRKAFCN